MKYKYKSDTITLSRKEGTPNERSSLDHFYEASIELTGHNLVWLDIFNSKANSNISFSMVQSDAKKKTTEVMIGESILPNGSFLSVFNHKLLSNKTIVIRASAIAVVSYEAREEIPSKEEL